MLGLPLHAPPAGRSEGCNSTCGINWLQAACAQQPHPDSTASLPSELAGSLTRPRAAAGGMQGRCRASLAALLLLALAAAASTATAAHPAPAEEPPLALPPTQEPAGVPPWATMPSAQAPASQASTPQAAPSGPTAVPAPPLQAPAAQAPPRQAATAVPAAQTPAAQAAAQLASVLRSQQLGNVAAAQAWDAGSLAADALGPAGVTLKVRVERQRAQALTCTRFEPLLALFHLLIVCSAGRPGGPVPVGRATIACCGADHWAGACGHAGGQPHLQPAGCGVPAAHPGL